MDKQDIYHLPAANVRGWNRTLCSVLDEMRRCHDTRNFAPLAGLIEDAQTYANRMEAKLSDISDYERLKDCYRKLREQTDALLQKGSDKEDIRDMLDLD